MGGGTTGHIWEAKLEDWDYVMRLNLRSAFLCTREAAAHMRERRSGSIVNLSSGAREGTPWTAYYIGNSAYAAAKAGDPRLYPRRRAGARRVWRAPSTPWRPARSRPSAPAPASARSSSSNTGRSAPRRCAASACPQDIANAVLYLASDEANYITGTTLAVAGGR